MTLPMPRFDLAQPRSVEDAVAMRQAHEKSGFIVGGTDVLVNMRHGIGRPDLLIDLSRIEELSAVEVSERGARIGAMVTVSALARRLLGALAEGARA